MSDLHYLSATDALSMFRSKELSPVELMAALISRAEEVEVHVNAFTHTFFDQAMDMARASEQRYAKDDPIGPLDGLAVAVKDLEPVAGQPWTMGSVLYKDNVADESAACLARVIDAGGIVHARTTTPEFGSGVFTKSVLYGVTRNPWNPQVAVGGSSGGSGASLAAGTTTLATGSDIGGSIRTPASYGGVVGYKPPYGRIPVNPPENLDTYLVYGPMARSIEDTILLQNVMAGPDESDVASLRPRLELPTSYPSVAGMRIAVSTDLGGWPVDPEVRENVRSVGHALRAAGAVVEEVDAAFPRDVVNRASCIHFAAITEFLRDLIRDHSDVLSPYLASTLTFHERYRDTDSAIEGWELESQLYRTLAGLFRSYDALIAPTVATRGLLADEDYVDGPLIVIDGQSFDSPLDVVPTLLFSILGRCPALSVPSGFASNGVPTGVQIVGPTYSDEVVFRVAMEVQRRKPWMDVPERRPRFDPSTGFQVRNGGAQ